jgi:hypothetical protein
MAHKVYGLLPYNALYSRYSKLIREIVNSKLKLLAELVACQFSFPKIVG